MKCNKIYKLFCLLLSSIVFIIFFSLIIIRTNIPKYKKLKDYDINISLIRSNIHSKENVCGENGK